jgi:hypothetical protein
MDIIVTVPRREYQTDAEEDKLLQKGIGRAFWTLSVRPANLYPGDRVYFIKNGVVESSMRCLKVSYGRQQCGLTDRWWSGWIVTMDDLRPANHAPMQGFRGFRYRTPDENFEVAIKPRTGVFAGIRQGGASSCGRI